MQAPLSAPRWRVWTFDAPAVVLGCAQRAQLEAARTRWPQDWELLLRPSGGGAVLTGPWMVSCSVALPAAHPWLQGRLPDSYQGLGALHVDVLQRLGLPCRALPSDEVAAANARLGPPVAWACYGSLAPWEVVDLAQGRKLVGLAQRRQRHGVLLVAGTLVTPPDWALLCAALGQQGDLATLQRRTVDCHSIDAAAAPTPAQCAAQLRAALQAALGVQESALAVGAGGC